MKHSAMRTRKPPKESHDCIENPRDLNEQKNKINYNPRTGNFEREEKKISDENGLEDNLVSKVLFRREEKKLCKLEPNDSHETFVSLLYFL